MRPRFIVPTFFCIVTTSLFGCSTQEAPNPVLTFNQGQETDTFADIKRFEVERIDLKGKSERIFRDNRLPDSIDMGNSGTYYFVAKGFDKNDTLVAVARSLKAKPGELLGAEIPMFFARTDRATRPLGSFESTPKQNPVAAVRDGHSIWYLDDSSDKTVETDSYDFAYWSQVTPDETYQSFTCPQTPCRLKNLVIVNGYLAVAIGETWALGIDTYYAKAEEFTTPDGISNWATVAGGRTLPGGNGTMILVGPTRLENPTDAVIGFGVDDSGAVTMAPVKTHTKRAGAALLFEEDFGLILASGSAKGAGVERLEPNGSEFKEIPYPADPIVGAALVMEDETHLLRVGGITADGSKAPTVRINIECTKDCSYELVPDFDLEIRGAQSFYDLTTKHTIIVGENADGLTEVFRYDSSGFTSIIFPKPQKRIRAFALELSNQQLGIIGGTDPEDDKSSRQDISVVAF
jgi:hypothetical protein